MRNIQKNYEPASLTQHRCSTHADYDNYTDKKRLRERLTGEQGCLCAYCMQRIRPEVGGMKIEHWRCQDLYPADQLRYGNLLGVCLGGEGFPKRDQHCDTRKGNTDFCLNPADSSHDVEALIRCLGNGLIKADDAALDLELNNVLNLNHPQLVRNRKAVLDSFTKSLPQGGLRRAAVQRIITEWITPAAGRLEPYCMVVVYWLRKRLART